MKRNYKKILSTVLASLMLFGISAQTYVDFESTTIPGAAFYKTDALSPGFERTSARAHSGSYSYYHTDYDSYYSLEDAWMVMPATTCGTNDELIFWYSHDYSSYYEYSGVWISTASNDPIANPGDFTELQELNAAAPGGFSEDVWTEYVTNLAAYSGQTVYVAFKYSGIYSHILYIDDFSIAPAPTCPAPSSFLASNITATTADFNWVSGGASVWNIEYGPTGFTPGTGTFVPNAANPFNLTGLTPETGYDVYVQDVCAIADLSAWVKTSFTTTCALITPAYNEDFSSMTSTVVPSCWSEARGGSALTGPTSLGASNWMNDEFLNNTSGSKSARVEFWNSGDVEWLISPSFDLSGATDWELGFDVGVTKFSGSGAATLDSDDEVILLISVDNGTTWNTLEVFNASNSPSNLGEVRNYNLSAYTSTAQFAFLANEGPTYGGVDLNFYVDNFDIHVLPTCPAPTDLVASGVTDTVAVLGWTPGGSAFANVEYGPAGFTPGTGQTIYNAFNPLTVDNLLPNTSYDFYVQDSCSASDLSAWTGPFNFTTACTTYSIPWNEGFEGITAAGNLPECTFKTGFITTLTAPGSYNRQARTGSKYLYTDYGEDDWFYTVPIKLTAGEVYEFSTWAINDGATGFDVTLNVGTGQNITSVTALLSSYNNIQSTSYTKLKGYYTAPTTGVYYFSIHVVSNYNPWYISFDDFKVDLAPSCLEPEDLISTYAAADSVVLNWTAGAGETAWNIEYGPVGFTPGTGTLVSSTATTDTIAGLSLGSFFDFYVQADCGSGDLSAWTGPVSVGTAITNDSTCNAILVLPNSDLSSRLFSNIGATTQPNEAAKLPGSRTHNNTVWFKTVVPASGHLIIATCFSDFNSILGVYAADTAICDSLETFREVGYSSTNSTICGVSNRGTLQFCDQTPGDTLIFYVGGSTASQSGIIDLIVSDWGVEGLAGQAQATPVTVCAGDTLNMFDYLTGQETNDIAWEYPSNPNAIINDSLINTGAMTLTGNEVYYIYRGNCNSDTATVVINASRQSNTGTAVSSFQACSNGDVFLFEGLTGTVDAGGTWSDDTNTGLVNGNKFVANGLPNGPYQFTYTVANNVCAPASTQITVNLVDCTNITEGESTTFGIYPNPNNGTFFITNGKNDNNIEMEVLDVQGKVIYSNTYSLAAGSQQEVSLGNVESGVYLIRVITNNQVFNSSVIVK